MANPIPPSRTSIRFGHFALLGLVIVSAIALSFKPGKLHLHFDIEQYLDSAYHLAHHHVYTEADTASPAAPAIGREPGYPLFLAGLMLLDPQFGRFTPDCLKADNACDPSIYRSASLANLGFILGAGVLIYLVTLRLCGISWAALAAAAYMLFNFQMNKHWADPMSDRFAVLLVCIAMYAALCAWQRKTLMSWSLVGLALAALTLTKASFFSYCVLLAVVVTVAGLVIRIERRRILASLAAAAIVYGAVVGGWAARNWTVSGQFRLTDLRGGIALSNREVFDHMSAQQYLASFVYWTRGFGETLARRLFPDEVLAPFDLYRRDGFYDRAQNGYPQRVREIAERRNISTFDAARAVDRSLVHAILDHPVSYVATTIPLLYRGIWIDEFAIIGFPLFCWVWVQSLRRRDALVIGLLSIGAFNWLFYASFSQDLPRYEMTAIPAVALAVGMASAAALKRIENRQLQRAAMKIA